MAANFISKLKNKYFLSFPGTGISAILGMATVAFLFWALPTNVYGIWIFFLTTYSLIDTFRSGFITTAFIKFYAGAEEKRGTEIVGSTWLLAYGITILLSGISLVGFLFSDKIKDPGTQLFFKWFAITFIVTLPSFIATCVMQAEQRFDRFLQIRFISQGLFLAIVIVLMAMKKANLQNVVYANIITGAVTSLLAIVRGWARVSSVRHRTRKGVGEMFQFGKYTVGTTLSSNLSSSADIFIINFMLGSAAVAIYNLGQKLVQTIEMPLSSFAATGMPELSAAYNKGDKAQVIQTMKKYAGMITWGLMPVCLFFIVFANIAILIIGGGAKHAGLGSLTGNEAANVLRIFMTFALLYPLDRFIALTLDVIHQPRINFIKVLVMMAGNVAADFLGIYIFKNIYGVALATVVPALIGISIGYWALRRYMPFNLLSVYKVGYNEFKSLIRQRLQKTKNV